jgi:hypothetical protein
MKPSHIEMAVNMELDAGNPAFIWGAPGIGKSAVVKAVAESRFLELLDIRALLLDPVDLRGIPSTDGDVTRWLPPAFLPRSGEGVMFLDELNAAPPVVAAALYGLILDGELGEYRLPDGWSIIAAGNNETDMAVTNRMPTPLANRFSHYEMVTDVHDWTAWAASADLDERVIAFVNWRTELLHKFDPRSRSKAFASPRSWEMVSKKLKAGIPDEILVPAISGTVGVEAASEFVGFLPLFGRLPDIRLALSNPDSFDIPANDAAIGYAIAANIGSLADAKNIDNVVKIADRLGNVYSEEFAVLSIRMATNKDKRLLETSAVTEFLANNASLMF